MCPDFLGPKKSGLLTDYHRSSCKPGSLIVLAWLPIRPGFGLGFAWDLLGIDRPSDYLSVASIEWLRDVLQRSWWIWQRAFLFSFFHKLSLRWQEEGVVFRPKFQWARVGPDFLVMSMKQSPPTRYSHLNEPETLHPSPGLKFGRRSFRSERSLAPRLNQRSPSPSTKLIKEWM
jgi:hypothetical protein